MDGLAQRTLSAIRIVREEPAHAAGVQAVAQAAFGPGRLAKTSERVRENGAVHAPELSRVALDAHGRVVACCQIWRVAFAGQAVAFLGPLAVLPERQGEGLGQAIARAATEACEAAGEKLVLLVGSPAFFGPLGFAQAPEGQVALPGAVDPKRLLWRGLNGGTLMGTGPVSGFRDASPT